MTQFQMLAMVLFGIVALLAYRNELLGLLKHIKLPTVVSEKTKPSIAVKIVDELVLITELRDKLASEGCAEGVEACTNLLRVIVEQTNPAKVAG